MWKLTTYWDILKRSVSTNCKIPMTSQVEVWNLGGVEKDFKEALLKRNYAKQEISDLLIKRNANDRGFSVLPIS